MSTTRPELQAPAEIFYGRSEAEKYTSSSRMIDVQTQMAERCMELLAIPPGSPPQLILDIGCGSGLSGAAISAAGHNWVGTDVSPDMLNVALERGHTSGGGDVALGDMGQGLPFRAGAFDGAVSVSAVQWLCYSTKKAHSIRQRQRAFFSSLYRCLRRGARAVLQVYPETPQQLQELTRSAERVGFSCGVLVDFPNSAKAKKIFLCLFTDTGAVRMPQARGTAAGTAAGGGAAGWDVEGGDDDDVSDEDDGGRLEAVGAAHGGARTGAANAAAAAVADAEAAKQQRRRRRRVPTDLSHRKGTRAWVLRKKELSRRRGKVVGRDSKYSGRSRGDRF